MILIYQKFLKKIEEGIEFSKTLPSIYECYNIYKQFQRPMFDWWDKNGLSDDEMIRLFASEYKNDVEERFTLLTAKGKTK